MHLASFPYARAPLTLLAALVCASAPFLAHAADGDPLKYTFRQPVPTLVVDSAVAPVGALMLSTSAINFGSVATHTSETRQVLVSNEGPGGLSFTAAPAVTGAAFAAGLTSCASSLALNASCLTEATFSPTTVGGFSGALTFATSLIGSPHTVSLSGTAFNPVSLTAATLPAAKLGQAYAPFDFASLLAVSNEASPTLADVSWSTTGALPAGLAFNSGTATLSGTPTEPTAGAGASFAVTSTYKNNQGQQVYTIRVGGVLLDVVRVAAGGFHTCALTTAGGLKCWGADFRGQLGNDVTLENQATPVDVLGLTTGVTSVSAGLASTCAVTTNGELKCWGNGEFGQLGSGEDSYTQPTPVSVPGLTMGVASVSMGEYHTCAVTMAGGLKCWGWNRFGQLGNDLLLVNQVFPVDVPGLTTGVASVSAGGTHTCAVTTSGGVKCWGSGDYGQLGSNEAMPVQPTPVNVLGLTTGVASVSAGSTHTCAVTTAGGVKCWGPNNAGQLGTDVALAIQPTPVNVLGLTTGVASVSAGSIHTCALTKAGGLKCWGWNVFGQLGNDSVFAQQAGPVDVLGLTNGVVHFSAGMHHSCAVTTLGGMKCWGSGDFGQLGSNEAMTVQPTPVNVAE